MSDTWHCTNAHINTLYGTACWLHCKAFAYDSTRCDFDGGRFSAAMEILRAYNRCVSGKRDKGGHGCMGACPMTMGMQRCRSIVVARRRERAACRQWIRRASSLRDKNRPTHATRG